MSFSSYRKILSLEFAPAGLFGKLNAGLLGQSLQSLPKIHVFLLHQERKYVAAGAARAETAPRAGFGENDEAGRSFLMKGATGFE